jgi:hypothetical protein
MTDKVVTSLRFEIGTGRDEAAAPVSVIALA